MPTDPVGGLFDAGLGVVRSAGWLELVEVGELTLRRDAVALRRFDPTSVGRNDLHWYGKVGPARVGRQNAPRTEYHRGRDDEGIR